MSKFWERTTFIAQGDDGKIYQLWTEFEYRRSSYRGTQKHNTGSVEWRVLPRLNAAKGRIEANDPSGGSVDFVPARKRIVTEITVDEGSALWEIANSSDPTVTMSFNGLDVPMAVEGRHEGDVGIQLDLICRSALDWSI